MLADAVCTVVRRNLTAAEWQRVAGNFGYETTCPDLPPGDTSGVLIPTLIQMSEQAVTGPGTPVALTSFFPIALHLPQGQPFRISQRGSQSLDDLAASFSDPERARRLLLNWGWEENTLPSLSSDKALFPLNAAGFVQLSVHRFASADGAAAALPYFAAEDRARLGYDSVDIGLFGEQAQAMKGRGYNGNDVWIYARQGNLVFRALAVALNKETDA